MGRSCDIIVSMIALEPFGIKIALPKSRSVWDGVIQKQISSTRQYSENQKLSIKYMIQKDF